jgi:DNA-binding transcriptional LysR family regulator
MNPSDLPRLLTFAAIAEHGSFTKAADALSTSKSVVSKHLQDLETRFGVQLVERNNRRVALTQAGEAMLAQLSRVRASLEELDDVAEAHRGTPVGTLRVTAAHDVVASIVAPAMARVGRDYPDVRFDVVCDDRPRDVIAERFDVAVRVSPVGVGTSGLITHKLLESAEVLLAAPVVAMRLKGAARPSDLLRERWLAHSATIQSPTWTFFGPGGETEDVVVHAHAVANAVEPLRMWLTAGAGIAACPRFMFMQELASGALVEVLPRWARRKVALNALLPSRRKPPRVRFFLEALKAETARRGATPR